MRTNYGICIRVWVYRPMLRYICYYSTLMTAFLQVKKHRNTPQARLRPTSPALRATSPCRGGFGIPQSFPSSPEAPLPGATATTAASGGNRESLLGQRPARRKRSAADAGCRNPGAKHLWRDGQAHAGRAKFLLLKTGVPCYRGQQLRNNILVKLLLISVAGHYFLRYIRLPVSSRK